LGGEERGARQRAAAALISRRRPCYTAPFSLVTDMKAYRYLTGKDDAAFCHRVTDWQLHGQPTLTFDSKRGEVICGQVITKEIEDTPYDPGMDLSKL
jgi:hypothetical protein